MQKPAWACQLKAAARKEMEKRSFKYDRKTQRAYVELRDGDAEGGDLIVTAMFSYRRTSIITKRALEQDLATKARLMMKLASVELDEVRN
jgi:hypothetical protein